MSKLIQMRRRIKAIETLKKVTHAMRLISMSAHSRLKNKQQTLNQYVTTVERLFQSATHSYPSWHNPIIHPTHTNNKALLIVVGSQKGLCGNFNNNILNRLTTLDHINNPQKTDVIVVGKKAIDMVKQIAPQSIVQTYENFSTQTFLSIAQALISTVATAPVAYQEVTIISTVSKSFFLQIPETTNLIPFKQQAQQEKGAKKEYLWTQPKEEILSTLAHYYLEAHIERLLFESLLAEQAARFISMDGSTRNAQNLLNETQLQYNKTRQAKITKDLTELMSSF